MTVVMGLIIVSFVIWGVGDMLRGFSAVDRRLGRRGENLGPGISRRLRSDDPAISAPAAPPVHQRGGAPDRPRPQRPAAAPERSGGRRRGAQARPRHFRRRVARDHHLEPEFPRQVRRIRSRPLRRRAARHGHERARLRLGIAQAGAEAVHRRGADDRHRRAQGRGHGGSRLSRARPGRSTISSFPPRRRARLPRLPRMRSRPSTTIASRATARPNTGR